MARTNLDDLIKYATTPDTAPKAAEVAAVTQMGTVTQIPARDDATPDEPVKKPARKQRRGSATKDASTPQRAAAQRLQEEPHEGTPLYLTFERKAVRLRADQYEELIFNARRLNKAKGPGGVRITENTLARVAFDLLISRMDELSGTTEEELRRSLGLPG